MKTLDKIFAWLLVVLGCIHAGSTLVVRPRLTADSIWFFVAGVAIVATGLLNVVRSQSGKGSAGPSAIAVNILMTVASLGLVWVYLGTLLHKPMLLIMTVAVIAELIFSVEG